MEKDNKKLIIILYIIMLIVAIGGPLIAINEQLQIDEVEVDNDYNEEELEDEEIIIDDEDEEIEEPEITDPDEEATPIDKLLITHPYKVTKESRLNLISSTDCEQCMSEAIIGEMYKNDISDNYKLIYTANQLIRHLDDKQAEGLYGLITIEEETLLANAKKIFKEVKIPNSFNNNLFYFGTYGLTCEKNLCSFTQETFGALGVTPIIGYATKTNEEDNTIEVDKIYVKEGNIDYDPETDMAILDVELYNDYKGVLIKELKEYRLDLSKEIDVYEAFSPYYESIDKHLFIFDEQNALVSVGKSR